MDRLKLVEHIISRKLAFFKEYEIHASWATVGLLNNGINNFKEKNPPFEISYTNKNYSPFKIQSDKFLNIPPEILSGETEIKWILGTRGQELASHTFSHFYTLEEGQTAQEFEEDCEQMEKFANQHDIILKSIVFPRNQINQDYLKICASKTFLTFRGNQESSSWSNSNYGSENIIKRSKRYADAYIKMEETNSYSIEELKVSNGLLNIPANRFLRPYSGKQWLENRKINRIKKEMSEAAKTAKIYHIWWHPHNFALNTEVSFSQLQDLLDHFKTLQNEYGFESLNMSEIAERRLK